MGDVSLSSLKRQTVPCSEGNGVSLCVLCNNAPTEIVQIGPCSVVAMVDAARSPIVSSCDDSTVSAEDGANL